MKDKLRKFILFVCVCVFLYSAFQLGKIFYDYYMIEKETTEIVTTYVTEEKDDDDPINRVVDFEKLKERNKDVIGWLYIPDTKIDEPILKGENNNSYLYTDIDKKSNKAGSVFIDEINKTDFNDDNTIIYGHNMKNGSRFHDVRYYIEQDYFDAHHTVYIYLPDGSVNVYNAYAAAIIEADSDLYQKGINYKKYTQSVIDQSKVKGEVSAEQKPLIMLSTCYNGTDNRYVLFAQFKENVKN